MLITAFLTIALPGIHSPRFRTTRAGAREVKLSNESLFPVSQDHEGGLYQETQFQESLSKTDKANRQDFEMMNLEQNGPNSTPLESRYQFGKEPL
jgi:hypothetical protein